MYLVNEMAQVEAVYTIYTSIEDLRLLLLSNGGGVKLSGVHAPPDRFVLKKGKSDVYIACFSRNCC